MDICKKCGKPFEQNKRGRKKIYCSKECDRAADRDNKRINYVGKREKVCRQCGEALPKNKTKFCSIECCRLYENIEKGAINHPEILKKTCPICGKEFETWKTQKITCSEKCSKIRRQRISDNSGIIIDYDISLIRLAERDGNICQICHQPIDWNDKTLIKKRYRYGNNYPSIDHIFPRSKGGLHCWDNVRLAHRYCNTLKGDK